MSERPEIKRQVLTTASNPESVSMNALPVVLLGGTPERRRTLAEALAGTPGQVAREAALPSRDGLASLLEGECDVLIVDLDQDADAGLELVEAACGLFPAITVMVYSRPADQDLLMRCMRAGAREFLTDPLPPSLITEAIIRASVRREELTGQKKTVGKCLVFVGAKGGSGVTTAASNFAVALAKESGQKVALLDLDLRLGDAALNLGLSSEFSTLDALGNEDRMDSELVTKLLVRHNSGLQVLAAPDEHNTFSPTTPAVMKLVNILRGDFAYLVVDAGTHYNGYGQDLFEAADKLYLITQVSIVELRNSHRFIAANFKGDAVRKLEVVLNRYAPRAGEIDEESINRALTVAPTWRIPSDFQTVRRAQNTATALAMKDGSIARVLTSMAKAACGRAEESRKRRFGLFS
jgi:pilus assembly protein CpaE